MAQITVYHGSDHVVKNPVYLGGKEDNDYGNGFYMTEYEERARSWAALNGDPEHAIVNIYHLDIDQLKVVDLNDCGVLAWIAEIAANRGTEQEATEALGDKIVTYYRMNTDACDVIKGYRADDSYTQVMEAFLQNQINVFEVERLFYKGALGNQIFLKSAKAFDCVKWVDSYPVVCTEEDKRADFLARREVNHFLSQRTKAILLEGYEVPGVTARYAIQNRLVYEKESGGYADTGIR